MGEAFCSEHALGDAIDVLEALGVRCAPVENEEQGMAGRDVGAVPGGRFAHLQSVGLIADDGGRGAQPEGTPSKRVSFGSDAFQQAGVDRFVEAVQPEGAVCLAAVEAVGKEGVEDGGDNRIGHNTLCILTIDFVTGL